MSRHELTPLPGKETYQIAVGWDPPLSTFFALVTCADDDPDTEVLWLGGTPGEIHDYEKVIDAVRPYAVVPDTLALDLYSEAHG